MSATKHRTRSLAIFERRRQLFRPLRVEQLESRKLLTFTHSLADGEDLILLGEAAVIDHLTKIYRHPTTLVVMYD